MCCALPIGQVMLKKVNKDRKSPVAIAFSEAAGVL